MVLGSFWVLAAAAEWVSSGCTGALKSPDILGVLQGNDGINSMAWSPFKSL